MNEAVTKQDYKHTISLPETAFPMKGDLPKREPGILAGWQAEGLGRRYAIDGKVVHGRELGRRLGFPTANLRLQGKRAALTGIFATWVHGVGKGAHASVSSLGTRPTVFGTEPLLEAHLFDFDGDLYGRRLRVEFVSKLRDEEKFADLPALVRQMNIDAEQARKVLRNDRTPIRSLA